MALSFHPPPRVPPPAAQGGGAVYLGGLPGASITLSDGANFDDNTAIPATLRRRDPPPPAAPSPPPQADAVYWYHEN